MGENSLCGLSTDRFNKLVNAALGGDNFKGAVIFGIKKEGKYPL